MCGCGSGRLYYAPAGCGLLPEAQAKSGTMRLDRYLVEQGLFASRTRARDAIVAGLVRVGGQVVRRPAFSVPDGAKVVVSAEACPYVSRGGLKLERALREFGLVLAGRRVLDLGASTGGFTDCALQAGAACVYAVDVGRGQLHPSLRTHPRVRSYEGLHLRALTLAHLDGQPVDCIVMDLSFISLRKVWPLLPDFLLPEGDLIALIKPQFELEARIRFKGGIVRAAALRKKAVRSVCEAAAAAGFHLHGLTRTEVEDARRKNVEYPALFRRRVAAVPFEALWQRVGE